MSVILMPKRGATRTLFVTGKGGAGKSLVAGALAREAVRHGMRVVLVDAIDPEDLTDLSAARTEPKVEKAVLEPRLALRHLLTRLLRFSFFSDRLMDSRTFSAVAAAAPGLSDLVRLDYLRELAHGRVSGRFDLLVVNAPASGHGIGLLEAPHKIADLFPVGPAAAVARAAREFTLDHRSFRAVVVALPEELSVAETEELHNELRRLRVGVSPTVVNGVYSERADPEQTEWLRTHPASSDARLYIERRERQLGLLREMASPQGAPIVLPYLFKAAAVGASDRGRLFDAVVRGWA
jgi:anion-transporting  ArsA/GET3 family ATPase